MVSLMNNEMEKYGRKHPMSNLVQYLSMSPGTEEASKKPVKLTSPHVKTSINLRQSKH